jgi:hypothetical protein
MTSIVTDFKSINRVLNRQEQKAEFEEKNPEPAMYGWVCGAIVAYAEAIKTPGARALLNIKI